MVTLTTVFLLLAVALINSSSSCGSALAATSDPTNPFDDTNADKSEVTNETPEELSNEELNAEQYSSGEQFERQDEEEFNEELDFEETQFLEQLETFEHDASDMSSDFEATAASFSSKHTDVFRKVLALQAENYKTHLSHMLNKFVTFASGRIKSLTKKEKQTIVEGLQKQGQKRASSGGAALNFLDVKAVTQSLQNAIQGSRTASSASDIPVPDRKTFYKVVWENTNLQNKQLDCSKSPCVVEFVKEEEEDNADTSKNHVRAVLDATGGSLVPPTMQYLRMSKSFKRFFAEDATRVQHIFSLMAHINEIVQQYNAQAQFADSNLKYQLSAPAKLNFFVDIVHNGSGVKPPLVLWNYYIRFFVYVSLSSTFPIFGFAHPMVGYTGNTDLKEKLEPLVWTNEDEIKGVIGSKLAYASAVWINQRDPPNRYYTDGYALVMEGIYRIETLFRNLEFKPTDGGLPMKDFVAVQELQLKAELSDNSNYLVDFSAYTSASFPIAMDTFCTN